MTAAETPAWVGHCPGAADLAAYAVGRLSEDTLEAVAGHLAGCRRCTELLGTLDDRDDRLTRNLGSPGPRSPYWDEPECGRLEAAARAIAASSQPTRAEPAPAATAPNREPPFPRAFGRYELLAKLGRGGMGIVYQARQLPLKRAVALKVLTAGAHAGPDERARFQREGEAITRLCHANIILVHDFGEHDGQPYFSMELAEGGNLSARLAGAPLPARQAAALVRTLARAIQHAHEHGVIHRDLKPSNILLMADGAPKVSDFGLAKVLDADGGQTLSDAILGTPSYMAPEQARGRARDVGPPTDVYALGAILYECLTGRPPFRAPTRGQTLEQVRCAEPASPSRALPNVSRELEAICLKCLEKAPRHRYPSADALADDLDRWLSGDSVVARPRRWPARVGKRIRRHPVLGALLVLAAVAAGLTPELLWYTDPDRPRKEWQHDLARGQAVTLLGETGMLRWSRSRARDARLATAGDGCLTIESWHLSLLELLPDPQRDRYRIQAWVRHEKSNDLGDVGIYCGHRQYGDGPAAIHQFTRLSYNDIRSNDEVFAKVVLHVPNAVPPPINSVTLTPYLYAEAGSGRAVDLAGAGLWPPFFKPAGLGGGPWRLLVLEVTPECVRAFWESRQVGGLPTADMRANTRKLLPGLVAVRPEDPAAQAVDPSFAPRGGLGLYVHNGSASFRSVTVEPLAEGD
jgi:hypothetical protein